MKKTIIITLASCALLAWCGKVDTTNVVVVNSSSNWLTWNSSISSTIATETLESSSNSIQTVSSTNSLSSADSSISSYKVVENWKTYTLKIPQLGISIDVPSSSANDTYYTITNKDWTKNAFIYPKSISEKYSYCTNGQFWPVLVKVDWTPETADKKNNDNYYFARKDSIKQFSWYFVFLEKPQSPCSYQKADLDYETSFVQSIINNFQSVSQI